MADERFVKAPLEYGFKYTKHIDEWVGFDLKAYDYVAPHGKGVIADFEVCFKWNGELNSKYDGMSLSIRFSEKFAGAYWDNRFTHTELVGVYHADPKTVYNKDFVFFEEAAKRNERGMVTLWNKKVFNREKVLVGRSRCEVDENEQLKSAMYFQITYLGFTCGQKGVGMRCVSYCNPSLNDTNLEGKR